MPTATTHVTLRSGPLPLEGLLSLPGPAEPSVGVAGVVVCHPHPLYGGDMENNVVAALADGLAARGMATLRFNFRGVGRSHGAFDHGVGEQEDARAAVQFLASHPAVDPRRVVLAGYSFGASVALAVAAAEPSLAALIAVSLPAARINADAFGDRALAKLFLAGTEDPIARPQAIREALQGLPPPTVVHLAPGADHSWRNHEAWLVDKVAEFLEAYVGPDRA